MCLAVSRMGFVAWCSIIVTPGKRNPRLGLVYIKYQATNNQNKVEVHIASGSG